MASKKNYTSVNFILSKLHALRDKVSDVNTESHLNDAIITVLKVRQNITEGTTTFKSQPRKRKN